LFYCIDHDAGESPLHPSTIVIDENMEKAQSTLNLFLINNGFKTFESHKFRLKELNLFTESVFLMNIENNVGEKRSSSTEKLRLFVSTDHPSYGFFPSAAIIIAENDLKAKEILKEKIEGNSNSYLKSNSNNDFNVNEIDLKTKQCILLCDGSI